MTRNYFYSKTRRAKTVRKNAFWCEKDGVKYLVSYETIVASIRGGKLYRLWAGYSSTTQNHVNAFAALFNVSGACKEEWLKMPVESLDYVTARAIKNIIVPVKTSYY